MEIILWSIGITIILTLVVIGADIFIDGGRNAND